MDEFDLREAISQPGAGRGFSVQPAGRWRMITAHIKVHGRNPDIHIDLKPGFFAVNFCLRGKGKYVDGPTGVEYELKPGTLFHRFPNRQHTTVFDPESDFVEFFVVVDADTAGSMTRMGLIPETPILDVGVQQSILDEFHDLAKSLRASKSEVPTPLALSRTIAFIQGLYERARQKRLQSYWERIVSDACAMLERNVEDRVSMEEIADKLGVSYTSFRKHFKRIMDCSPGEFRVRFRLDRAKDLLTVSSVKHVAASLGYCDPFTFSAQFKSATGMSPREFQRTFRGTARA